MSPRPLGSHSPFEPVLMICPPTAERPWRRATAYHWREDAHITVAAVFRTRRAFMDAGWETRLIADADEPFLLSLDVRALPGCDEPTFTDGSVAQDAAEVQPA